MKGITGQNKARQIELFRKVIDPDTKKVKMENDFSRANMDIVVEVGPSSSTKRKATVDSLTNILKFAVEPETQSIITSMIMMNMEGEGVSEVREFFRNKLVQSGVLKPTEDEAKALAAAAQAAQNQPPTAEEEFLKSEASKNESEVMKNMASIGKTIAEAGKAEAQTAEIIEGIDREDRAEIFREVDKLNQSD